MAGTNVNAPEYYGAGVAPIGPDGQPMLMHPVGGVYAGGGLPVYGPAVYGGGGELYPVDPAVMGHAPYVSGATYYAYDYDAGAYAAADTDTDVAATLTDDELPDDTPTATPTDTPTETPTDAPAVVAPASVDAKMPVVPDVVADRSHGHKELVTTRDGGTVGAP